GVVGRRRRRRGASSGVVGRRRGASSGVVGRRRRGAPSSSSSAGAVARAWRGVLTAETGRTVRRRGPPAPQAPAPRVAFPVIPVAVFVAVASPAPFIGEPGFNLVADPTVGFPANPATDPKAIAVDARGSLWFDITTCVPVHDDPPTPDSGLL